MGGTFPATPIEYQTWFIQRCLDAITGKTSASLEEAKINAEVSQTRNVGITVETRPDWAKQPHIDGMLSMGVTRIELGVQNPDDAIYRLVGRTHTVADVVEATQIAKDAGLKIVYHMMPGMPGSNPAKDLEAFNRIFTDPAFKPDMIKIYPCLAIDGTKAYQWYKEGTYNPYSTEQAAEVIGGCEETTTGVRRLENLDREGKLLFPMIEVNNAYCKYLFDNRYGTGESVWSGIMRTTNLVVAGKAVVVLGYGWCGKGVAMRARGLGARVIVCEIDPIRAIEAIMDGYQVMGSKEAAPAGDIFITVTGCCDVLDKRHFASMKDGAVLANAGHFDLEINKVQLAGMAVRRCLARQNIEQFDLPGGRRIYLLAEGRLVNLAAGDGHPAEIMDMSFAIQALSARYIIENAGNLVKKLYPVPGEIDCRVASLKLKSLGIEIDSLTEEQEAYLNE
jgi:adenosylhomocysteinase